MASHSVDIKLSFERYDMTPGPAGRRFRRNLLMHGGRANARGYSFADAFLRRDEGAVLGPANALAIGLPAPVAAPLAPVGPWPGAPNLAGAAGTAQQQGAMAARRVLLREGFKFIVGHIDHEPTKIILAGDRYFQDAAETFDYIMGIVIVGIDAGVLEEMNSEWFLLSIICDVGSHENTVIDLVTMLQVINSERPVAEQFTNNQLAEKTLIMIKNASKTLAQDALDELNKIEGVPGTPGVRRFQLVGMPRPRDLSGIRDHFHMLWRDGVKNGRIPKMTKVGARQAPTLKQHVEAGRAVTWAALEDIEMMGGISAYLAKDVHSSTAMRTLERAAMLHTTGRETERAFQLPDARGSPMRSLGELRDAGFLIQRGTVIPRERIDSLNATG